MKKKFVEVLFLLGMVTFCLSNTDDEQEVPEEKAVKEIIDTIDIDTISNDNNIDYAKLYTCKEDVRVKDDSIIEVTSDEAQILMKLGLVEGGDKDALSQAYVMQTVLNRVYSDEFPDTITEVVFQKNPLQFSSTTDGKYKQSVPNADSHVALAMLESGNIENEALYFEASWLKNSWQSKNREYLFSYNGTTYYK